MPEFECSGFEVATLPSGRFKVTLSNAEPAEETWTKKDCARNLRVVPRTIEGYMRLSTRPIPYSKIKGRVRFSRKDVEGWLKEMDFARRVSSF